MKKINKEPRKGSKKKTLLVIMGAIALLGSTSVAGIKYVEESNRVSMKKEITIETGTAKPVLESYVTKWGNLDPKSEVTYKNTDKEAAEKDLTTVITYKNSKGEEVKKEDAYEEKKASEKTTATNKKTSVENQISTAKHTVFNNTEAKAVKTTDKGTTKKENTEKGKTEVLKKGITKTEEIVGVGTYEVTIKDKSNKKTYKATLKVIDKTAPVLNVKESYEMTEGDELKIESLVEKCSDNSHTSCFYEYVNDKDEKVESDDIDTDAGERELRVRAYDVSKNYSKTEVIKLKVNEKPVEKVEEAVSAGNYSGGGSYSGTRRNYSRGGSTGYSGGNSGGSAGGSAGGSSGGACTSYNTGGRPMFYDAGVNGLDVMDFYTVHDRYAGSQNGPLGRILFSVLDPCNAKYGPGSCGSDSTAISIYCNGINNRLRGIAEYITVTGPGGATVGEGWALPGGGVQWISKDF